MGRSYYVDETVQRYFTKILQQKKKNNVVTGLLIGHCSLQRDYIVLAVQTPPKEDQCQGPERKIGSSRLEEIDEEWFCIHASQVSRMLPGGFLLVGAFLISPPEVSKESLNVLRKLIFATEKSAMKNKLWNLTDEDVTDRVALQICSSTNKVVCRTFDVKDPKSTAKPADWKYQSSPVSWLTIECNLHVDLTVSFPSSSSYPEQQKCLRTRLAQWAKDIEDCTILFNGRLKDTESDLLEEQKKGRSVASSGRQIVSATILSPSNISDRRTARVRVCNSSLHIGGVVKCRGYISNNKPKVKDAVQQKTLPEAEKSQRPLPLPQRVFVPIPGSGAALCDYVMGEETGEEVRSRLLEMLDQDVNYDDLEFAEEKTTIASSGM
ncbi:PREDICTED: protein odr-4 homolog [Nanorana parkeri]|uniref:protein odr-4 homolog n=1 Tax=Nanorana parkeri TaxID=125878 RepID=UPI0008541044|nr:PREDICTED: protein odr-4 homolog [Nanorana parkeri]